MLSAECSDLTNILRPSKPLRNPFSAAVDTHKVRINEAFTFYIRVAGSGNLNQFNLPKIDFPTIRPINLNSGIPQCFNFMTAFGSMPIADLFDVLLNNRLD